MAINRTDAERQRLIEEAAANLSALRAEQKDSDTAKCEQHRAECVKASKSAEARALLAATRGQVKAEATAAKLREQARAVVAGADAITADAEKALTATLPDGIGVKAYRTWASRTSAREGVAFSKAYREARRAKVAAEVAAEQEARKA